MNDQTPTPVASPRRFSPTRPPQSTATYGEKGVAKPGADSSGSQDSVTWLRLDDLKESPAGRGFVERLDGVREAHEVFRCVRVLMQSSSCASSIVIAAWHTQTPCSRGVEEQLFRAEPVQSQYLLGMQCYILVGASHLFSCVQVVPQRARLSYLQYRRHVFLEVCGGIVVQHARCLR